jgi:hypothetical protein
MSNIVQYGSYDIEAAEAEQVEIDRAGSSAYMKLAVGRNIVRLLPPPYGRNTPFATAFQHYFSVPGLPQDVKFNCPRIMANQRCPACDKAIVLKSSASKADQDSASDYWARRRIYCVAIDRNDEDAGPKILAIGKKLHEEFIDLRRDPDLQVDYTNPDSGYDVIITRKGTGRFDTTYKLTIARNQSPLGNMEWVVTAPDLKPLLYVPTYDEIVAMVQGAPQTKALPKQPTQQLSGHVVVDDGDYVPF